MQQNTSKKYGIKHADVLKYRGNGWFGSFRAYRNDKVIFEKAYSDYFSSAFSEKFWQGVCIKKCTDHFVKYADVAMEDADFIKYNYQNGNSGETMCFVNNYEIKEILMDMQKEDIVELSTELSVEDFSRIYGPLCESKRAQEENMEQNYKKILRGERVKNILRLLHIF